MHSRWSSDRRETARCDAVDTILLDARASFGSEGPGPHSNAVEDTATGCHKGDSMMKTLDTDEIMARAKPLAHQQAHEIQPYGHLVRMPIALSETACKESVENLNQILA